MDPRSAFETLGTRGFYRPSGSASDGQLADFITEFLRYARNEGLRDVLINISAMTGFRSPGPAYRRWVAARWAEAAAGMLAVAVVARPEHICPEKTGLLVAAEKGLDAHICDAEPEAIAWLETRLTNGPMAYTQRTR